METREGVCGRDVEIHSSAGTAQHYRKALFSHRVQRDLKKPQQTLQHQSAAGIEQLWGGDLAPGGSQPQAAGDGGISTWITLLSLSSVSSETHAMKLGCPDEPWHLSISIQHCKLT